MVYLLRTKNHMTTAYYYNVLKSAAEKAFSSDVVCVDALSELNKFKPNRRTDVIITGHVKDAFCLLIKGYKRTIVWCQGVIPEERKMQKERFWKVALNTIVEKYACKHVPFTILVSEAQKRHYEKKYHIKYHENYYIMPCFNEEGINSKNFISPSEGNLVFSYTGGLGVWQCVEQTLDIYKEIEKKHPAAQFRFYTNQVAKANVLLERSKVKNYICEYIPQQELKDALKEVHFGFVIREDDIVNRVATPTKFSTYLANGVIPIYSSCISSFANAMRDKHYKVELNSMDPVFCANEIEKFLSSTIDVQDMKSEYSEMFHSYYGTKEHIMQLSDKLKRFFE